MSERSSGQHLELVDPADLRALDEMKSTLAEALKQRLNSGLTGSFISQSLGHRSAFMFRVLDPQDRPQGWKFNEWHDLCLGSLAIPRLCFTDLPEGVDDPLWQMARAKPEFLGVGAMALLKQIRVARGWTLRSLAQERDVVYSAIRHVEESDNPKLGTIMRYARWVGSPGRIGIVRAWRGEMGEWK